MNGWHGMRYVLLMLQMRVCAAIFRLKSSVVKGLVGAVW